MPPTITTVLHRLPPPLRKLGQFIFGERAVAGPHAIHLDVAQRFLDEAVAETVACAAEAAEIEHRVDHAKLTLAAALSDNVTPGIITEQESRAITRELLGTSTLAHHHTQHLRALV